MKVELSFTPPPHDVAPNKFKFFAKVNYQMFPEMLEEFKQEDPQIMKYSNQFIEMNEDEGDEGNGIVEYFLEVELPYGSIEPQLYFRPNAEGDGAVIGDAAEPQPLWGEMQEYFRKSCEPEPISRDEQQKLDD